MCRTAVLLSEVYRAIGKLSMISRPYQRPLHPTAASATQEWADVCTKKPRLDVMSLPGFRDRAERLERNIVVHVHQIRGSRRLWRGGTRLLLLLCRTAL